MSVDAGQIREFVEADLTRLSDRRVVAHIRSLLVEPAPVLRDWDYGDRGQQYICWTVLEHEPSNTGIAYCETGFGPANPWGLVSLGGAHMSIGMDSGWFRTFLEAYFDSMAVTVLPIWRVYKTNRSGVRHAITPEGGWDATWEQVLAHRKADVDAKYDCETDARPERD